MDDHNNIHDDLNAQFNEHLLPLRDRIVKIETVINYHDKEFTNVKDSINKLSETVDRNQKQILERMEHHNKNYMDVLYSQYREMNEHNIQIDRKIQDNKNTFNTFVTKWKAISWAVWFTISVTLGAVGWGISTAKDLGFFNTQQVKAQQQQQSKL
jgi:hypothetical protein